MYAEIDFAALFGLLECPLRRSFGRLRVGETVRFQRFSVYRSVAGALAGENLEQAALAAEDVAPELLDVEDFGLCYHLTTPWVRELTWPGCRGSASSRLLVDVQSIQVPLEVGQVVFRVFVFSAEQFPPNDCGAQHD